MEKCVKIKRSSAARSLWLPVLVALFLSGCSPAAPLGTSDFPLTLARRSVLDQQVRMLTLTFGPDRFAAYNLEKARLEKIWRGGVLWNGAAFNNMKTVQPESYGNTYWEQSQSNDPWSIEENGEKRSQKASYRAYTLLEQGIQLEYAISDGQGQEIIVTEQPQFAERNGRAFFLRQFHLKNKLPGASLYFGSLLIDPEAGATYEQDLGLQEAVGAAPPVANDNSSQYWLERSGCNTCHDHTQMEIGPSYEAIAARYESNKENLAQLTTKVQNGGSGQWGNVAMIPHANLDQADIQRMVQYILSLRPKDENKATARAVKKTVEEVPERTPGFGAPLESVHPAYDLITIRPDAFRPRIGGMAFLPNGELLVSTWDSIGAVYALSGVQSGDTNQIRLRRVASGLSEPLGLTTVGDDIYVMQKHELTQLIDTNGDGITDEYRCVSQDFGATPDFHEFSYGLVYRDGYFYGGLGLAMRLMSHELQQADRGTVFRVGPDGTLEKIANGLRQPNGLGLGPDGELFVTENQGQWVPACKFIHIEEGAFYGCQFGGGDRYAGKEATPPAVWMPQDEIGNSPSQPLLMQDGPYTGQMIYGEVTHGGIKRVFLEKVNGAYQGSVFRFCQGLEAGINRMAWGPDGGLYVGGVGMNGNWAHLGHQFGLQKLMFNGKVPFEILAMRAQADGFELEFTQPLPAQLPDLTGMISVEQWRYEATPAYGGPKLDEQELRVTATRRSADGKKLYLRIPGLKKGFVIHLLLDPTLQSREGAHLWTGEAWYTLNNIPRDI